MYEFLTKKKKDLPSKTVKIPLETEFSRRSGVGLIYQAWHVTAHTTWSAERSHVVPEIKCATIYREDRRWSRIHNTLHYWSPSAASVECWSAGEHDAEPEPSPERRSADPGRREVQHTHNHHHNNNTYTDIIMYIIISTHIHTDIIISEDITHARVIYLLYFSYCHVCIWTLSL